MVPLSPIKAFSLVLHLKGLGYAGFIGVSRPIEVLMWSQLEVDQLLEQCQDRQLQVQHTLKLCEEEKRQIFLDKLIMSLGVAWHVEIL